MIAPMVREDYEAEVRAIRFVCDVLLASGEPVEMVARRAVFARNQLKRKFRQGLPQEILDVIEARNVTIYGDPLGPKPEDQFARYGSWLKVIDAASRPSSLSTKGRSPI